MCSSRHMGGKRGGEGVVVGIREGRCSGIGRGRGGV